MASSSLLISQIYTSRNVLLQLMKRQQFNVTDYEKCSINEVNTMKNNNQLDMLLTKNNGTNEKVYIKYHLAKPMRPDKLQEMLDDLFSTEEVLTKKDCLIVVIKEEINQTMMNMLKHIWETEKLFVVVHSLARLQFNCLEHVLVPPHRVLANDEAQTVMERYNVHTHELPELSRFDPIAMAIGIRPGQICEILRPSKTAISSKYYRLCV